MFAVRQDFPSRSPPGPRAARRTAPRPSPRPSPRASPSGASPKIKVVQVNLWHNSGGAIGGGGGKRQARLSGKAAHPQSPAGPPAAMPNVESAASKYKRLHTQKCEEEAECQRQLAGARVEAESLRAGLRESQGCSKKAADALQYRLGAMTEQYERKCLEELAGREVARQAAEDAAGLRAALLRAAAEAAAESAGLRAAAASLQLGAVDLHAQLLEVREAAAAGQAELQAGLQAELFEANRQACNEAAAAEADQQALRAALAHAEDEAVEFEEIATAMEKRMRSNEADVRRIPCPRHRPCW